MVHSYAAARVGPRPLSDFDSNTKHILLCDNRFSFTFVVRAYRPYHTTYIQMEQAEVVTITKPLTENVAIRPEMAKVGSEPE